MLITLHDGTSGVGEVSHILNPKPYTDCTCQKQRAIRINPTKTLINSKITFYSFYPICSVSTLH